MKKQKAIQADIIADLEARERTAFARQEALLNVLEYMSTIKTLPQAYEALTKSAAQLIDCKYICVARDFDVATDIKHANDAELIDQRLVAPLNAFSEPKFITNISENPEWSHGLPQVLAQMQHLMCLTILQDHHNKILLLCFDDRESAFCEDDLELLARLASIAANRLKSFELTTKNNLLAATIDKSPFGVAIADASRDDMPLVYVNDAFGRISGYQADEVLGRNCRFLSVEPKQSPERKRLRKHIEMQKAGHFLLRNQRRDGEQFWNELSLFPVDGHDGHSKYMVATQLNVTTRVEVQEELRQMRRDLDDALSNITDAFLLLDHNKNVKYANAALIALFPSSHLKWDVGTDFTENLHSFISGLSSDIEDQVEAFEFPKLEELVQLTQGYEIAMPGDRYYLVHAQLTSANGFVLTATEVTKLKSTETLLRQRVAAIENTQDGIGIANEDGAIFYTNPSFNRLVNAHSVDEIYGKNWQEFYIGDMGSKTLQHADIYEKLIAQRHDKFGVLQYHEISLTDVPNVGLVIIICDVTERIERQRRTAELQEQLELSKRQEAIAELAAGVAHDFNNLISAINGSAQLIASDKSADHDILTHANRIVTAGNRAVKLVNRLQNMGVSPDHKGYFDLGAALRETRELLRNSLRQYTELTMSLPENSIQGIGTTTDAIQLAMNLILNAQDALDDDGGKIDIALDIANLEADFKPVVGEILEDTPYAVLTVRDTGSGMSSEVIHQIFERYFTTKGSKGTGLGLAMVEIILRRNRGALYLKSKLGEGTEFIVYWPLFEAQNEDVSEHNILSSTIDLKGHAILLVDDQLEVREVIQSYLEQLGAEVCACDHPQELLDAFTEDPDCWSLIITDYDMPDMNGGDLVDRVREISEDMPIIVITALAHKLKDTRLQADNVLDIFPKPLNLSKLAQDIDACFQTQRTS